MVLDSKYPKDQIILPSFVNYTKSDYVTMTNRNICGILQRGLLFNKRRSGDVPGWDQKKNFLLRKIKEYIGVTDEFTYNPPKIIHDHTVEDLYLTIDFAGDWLFSEMDDFDNDVWLEWKSRFNVDGTCASYIVLSFL